MFDRTCQYVQSGGYRLKVEHSKPLSRDEIPDLLKKLDGYSGYRTTNITLRLLPLSLQAVELLRELHTLTSGQQWLFTNYRRPKTVMTATTLNRALECMGYGGRFSAHGFWATASTILNELGYRSNVIERQLAHKERNKVRASYNQAEYLKDRIQMMQAWADLIDTLREGEGKVVQGNFGKAV